MKNRLSLLLLSLLVFPLVFSCGGGDGDSGSESGSSGNPEPTVDVTGDWSGTWNSDNGVDGGSASLSVSQSGASISGSITFTGSPCFSAASVSGTVSGNDVSGSMTAGGIRVDVEMTVIGSQASGTYNVVNAGICTGDFGTIVLELDGTGGAIAFTSNRDVNAQIYVMEADGRNQRNISNSSSYDSTPAWSPDGTQIAFTSRRDGNYEIYVMDANGDNQRNISNSSSDDRFPAWSLDGTQIAFDSFRDGNYEIYVMDSDGGNQRNISNDSSYYDRFPAWSLDGTQIAFDSLRDGNYEIYVMDANGDNQRNISCVRDEEDLCLVNSSTDRFPAWSPDGTQIAFTSNRDGNYEIYVMDANGDNQRNISCVRDEEDRCLENLSADRFPAWSPDGTQITFDSFRDGNTEIYVMDSDGGNQRRMTNSSSRDSESAWKP